MSVEKIYPGDNGEFSDYDQDHRNALNELDDPKRNKQKEEVFKADELAIKVIQKQKKGSGQEGMPSNHKEKHGSGKEGMPSNHKEKYGSGKEGMPSNHKETKAKGADNQADRKGKKRDGGEFFGSLFTVEEPSQSNKAEEEKLRILKKDVRDLNRDHQEEGYAMQEAALIEINDSFLESSMAMPTVHDISRSQSRKNELIDRRAKINSKISERDQQIRPLINKGVKEL